MAEAFESPPPFIAPKLFLGHYLVRCGGASSYEVVKRVWLRGYIHVLMTRMVVND